MQWQNASYSAFFCFPSGLMDIDMLPYTPRTRASARRSAGRRLLNFQMMMSALKVCDGWRRLFGTRWGRISPKKQVYLPQVPVNATCLTQQRDVHASVLSFPNRNTERWEQRWTACCYANSSQFTNGSSLNTDTRALPVGEDWNRHLSDLWASEMRLKEDWGLTLEDKPFRRLLHGFPSFIKCRW